MLKGSETEEGIETSPPEGEAKAPHPTPEPSSITGMKTT